MLLAYGVSPGGGLHLATPGGGPAPRALPSRPAWSAEGPLGIREVWDVNWLEGEAVYKFPLPPGICAPVHFIQSLGRHPRRQQSVTLHSQGQAVTQDLALRRKPRAWGLVLCSHLEILHNFIFQSVFSTDGTMELALGIAPRLSRGPASRLPGMGSWSRLSHRPHRRPLPPASQPYCSPSPSSASPSVGTVLLPILHMR